MAFRHVYSVGTVAKAVTDKAAKRAYGAMVYSVASKAKVVKVKSSKANKA